MTVPVNTYPSANPNAHMPKNLQPTDLYEQINSALLTYSDKDWNYSRISLVMCPLDKLDCPYTLKIDLLDQTTKAGQEELKTLTSEVKWGDRHSSELGMLEVVSLRINKALLEITTNEDWNQKRPVIRIAKRQQVDSETNTSVLWYQIIEVSGEEFDNR
jgi:hypothetical protein